MGVRYLLNPDNDKQISERMELLNNYLLTPKVVLLQYFGVVDGDSVIGIKPSDERAVSNIYRISIEAQIKSGSLQVRWSYNENVYTEPTINRLVNSSDGLMQKIVQQLNDESSLVESLVTA